MRCRHPGCFDCFARWLAGAMRRLTHCCLHPMLMEPNQRFEQHLHEMKEWLQINGQPDAMDEDAIEALESECGMMADGSCTKDGSEYCDFECPFA